MPVSDINSAYETNSNKYKNTFDLLNKLRVIKNPLKLCEYGKKPREEIEVFEKEGIAALINDPKDEFEELLDDKTLQNYKNIYEEGVKEIYDEAMRRHENIISSHIPLWAWILLIYVGYKDVWKMFTGYWLVILLFGSGAFALLKMLGLGSAPMMVINMIQNQIKQILTKQKIN